MLKWCAKRNLHWHFFPFLSPHIYQLTDCFPSKYQKSFACSKLISHWLLTSCEEKQTFPLHGDGYFPKVCVMTHRDRHFFLKKSIYFKSKDNCFTMWHWFLPYINVNQAKVYVRPLPLEPTSLLPSHTTPLGWCCPQRALDLSFLHHSLNVHRLSSFTYSNVYVSMWDDLEYYL